MKLSGNGSSPGSEGNQSNTNTPHNKEGSSQQTIAMGLKEHERGATIGQHSRQSGVSHGSSGSGLRLNLGGVNQFNDDDDSDYDGEEEEEEDEDEDDQYAAYGNQDDRVFNSNNGQQQGKQKHS